MTPSVTLRHRFEYACFRLLEWVVLRLSDRMARSLGRGMGRLFRSVDARHRRVVRDNLRASDLELDESRIEELSRTCYEHYGETFLQTLRIQHMDRETLLSRVRIEGLEHWDAAAAEGRGFIVLTGHYGCWEALALALSALDRPFAVIGRELDNPLLAPHLDRLRNRFGNQVIPKSGAFRESLKVFKRGGGVGFLLDQDALTNGIFVRFLGRWASTFPSAGLLAVKYDLPVLPLFSWPEPDGTVSMRIDPPFHVPRTGDTDRDVWTATQLCSDRIQAEIRRDPRWWFWMHRRFKTRPGEGCPLPAPLPPSEWLEAIPASHTRG